MSPCTQFTWLYCTLYYMRCSCLMAFLNLTYIHFFFSPYGIAFATHCGSLYLLFINIIDVRKQHTAFFILYPDLDLPVASLFMVFLGTSEFLSHFNLSCYLFNVSTHDTNHINRRNPHWGDLGSMNIRIVLSYLHGNACNNVSEMHNCYDIKMPTVFVSTIQFFLSMINIFFAAQPALCWVQYLHIVFILIKHHILHILQWE